MDVDNNLTNLAEEAHPEQVALHEAKAALDRAILQHAHWIEHNQRLRAQLREGEASLSAAKGKLDTAQRKYADQVWLHRPKDVDTKHDHQ